MPPLGPLVRWGFCFCWGWKRGKKGADQTTEAKIGIVIVGDRFTPPDLRDQLQSRLRDNFKKHLIKYINIINLFKQPPE